MNNPYGIYEKSYSLMLDCFSKEEKIESVHLFGSRAMGNYKKGSDIDIALKGSEINNSVVSKISGILNEDLPIPYFFDVLNYHSITNQDLVQHIDLKGKLIFQRSKDENIKS